LFTNGESRVLYYLTLRALNRRRRRGRRRGGGVGGGVCVVRETTFIMEGGKGDRKFTAAKGSRRSRQCPVFLLVQVDWRQATAFGSEEST
jgi:hypothetical protein